ncbi:hypothetical protein [Priestia endophytica]|uniref:hypothetical protein n=1 Tax=Priestia endophytica TaxID=135735 RepID=UPI00227DF82C|nr:hypothetical protein [Priestia endophytica]MCY8235447.1 hypothetical protein [Priestia endophytica]
MSDLANEVNKIFSEGDRIDVQFFGFPSFQSGVFVQAKDNFLLWVDDSDNQLKIAPLNQVRIDKK